MSLFRKRSHQPLPPDAELSYHPIRSNFMDLFLANFKLIPFFLPSIVLLLSFLITGALLYLAGGLLLLIPAAPAVTAMYDLGYQLTREIPKHERRGFWGSYRMNFRQSSATMAVQLPLWAMLVIVLIAGTERPAVITLCVVLGCLMLLAFSILSFSQIALVDLSLRKIWKNAVMLIPLCPLQALGTALVQLLFIAMLYKYIAVTFLFYLFAVPTLLIVWSAKTLWPKLEELLLDV